ncbi:hypothetical protein [uncultured Pseudomonas sp.]|uniref:hypothetical protein n=1 Tax=uncultured Pseudomonas sp. TaxID=114707 RepID=UPI002586C115|nr:hypothetical protein [uncultured Pseudomonas sp.]
MRRDYVSSAMVGIFYAICFVFFSSLSIFLAFYSPWFSLNENQVMYLYSTSAQVLAAVYGLTLTGYLFFRGELQREARNDDSLVESIAKLERRYLVQLIVITALVGITIFLINLVIAQEQSASVRISIVLMNTAQAGFAVSFLAIALFVLDVIRPFRVEGASKDIQNEIDPAHSQEDKKGSLEEFIINYNQIESILRRSDNAIVPYVGDEAFGAEKKKRFISNVRLAEMLWRRELIGYALMSELKELISLRNAIVHGAVPVVSQEIVDRSSRVLDELRFALKVE